MTDDKLLKDGFGSAGWGAAMTAYSVLLGRFRGNILFMLLRRMFWKILETYVGRTVD